MITEDEYDQLPDELRKLIEVIDDHILFICQSGSVEHSDVARRLANRLEAARPEEPCTRVSTDVDVYFHQRNKEYKTFSFRRPDVTVYRCKERGTKLQSTDALLVAEVVSPGSGRMDTLEKLAEYADERIPVYLTVHLDENLYVKVIKEYRLDWVANGDRGRYRLWEAHERTLKLDVPFPVEIPLSDLDG